jgi:fumarate hydratase subunit beta
VFSLPNKTIKLNTDELKDAVFGLEVGDRVILSGTIYTARDAAHKRLFELLDAGKKLPFNLKGAIIYYAGPTPAREGMAVGSCGPTTSSRMDAFSPRLLDLGLLAMIGKGERSEKVVSAIVRNNAIYLCAVGGAGALIARHITSSEVVAFHELGCESIKRMTIDSLPLTVGIDCTGASIYEHAKTSI